MKWSTIDADYINYLKKFDKRIPDIEYGEYKFKPFFSPLFTVDNLTYVTQISSKKDRHLNMKEQIDFIKIYARDNKNLLGVVNLNYMFPVPKDKIKIIEYKDIELYRNFRSDREKKLYISLLKIEIEKIKEKKVDLSAKKLYEIVKTNSFISKRCLDYCFLEEKAMEYIKQQRQEKESIVLQKEKSFEMINGITGRKISIVNSVDLPEKKFNTAVWIPEEMINKNSQNIKIKENEKPLETEIFGITKDRKPCIVKKKLYNIEQLEINERTIKIYKEPIKEEKMIEKVKAKGYER